MKSSLRLFKSVIVEDVSKVSENVDVELLAKTIPYGFIFSPVVTGNFSSDKLEHLVKDALDVFGLSGEQINLSFHKSWNKIKEASLEELVLEQIFHYLTTYGFESIGVYSQNAVFIPQEKLNIPDLEIDGIELVVINGSSKEEMKYKLLDIINSNIALKGKTVDDVCKLASVVELSEKEIANSKNREVKVVLFDHLNIIPESPVEFLRYVIYKVTGSKLLIKNSSLIKKIKQNIFCVDINAFLEKYEKEYGLDKLAQIFYRFKPLFLAFRRNDNIVRHKINKIRKLAVKNHVPMKKDYFNTITEQISKGTFDINEFSEKIEEIDIFRKVRLANTLAYRSNKKATSILYLIRNNKGFTKELNLVNVEEMEKALNVVVDSIANELKPFVSGKKFYIPENVSYSMPSSEKQFSGYFPYGTFITVPDDLILGIYWENVNSKRIDLDLSLVTLKKKYGWDSYYRSKDKDILFSGDMTDASNGASEMFYLRNVNSSAHLLLVNYYNASSLTPIVPFKLFVAYEKPDEFEKDSFLANKSKEKHYMVNPNNVIVSIENDIHYDKREKTLGIVVIDGAQSKFYFSEYASSNLISSVSNQYSEYARKYFIEYHESLIRFSDIIKKAGGIVYNKKDELNGSKYIDLSINALEKDTFIKILKGKI